MVIHCHPFPCVPIQAHCREADTCSMSTVCQQVQREPFGGENRQELSLTPHQSVRFWFDTILDYWTVHVSSIWKLLALISESLCKVINYIIHYYYIRLCQVLCQLVRQCISCDLKKSLCYHHSPIYITNNLFLLINRILYLIIIIV